MQSIIISNLVDSDKIKQQLITLGAEKIKSLGYHLTKINKAMGIKVFDKGILDSAILSRFSINDRYLNKIGKEIIKEIYEEVGFNGAAKASVIQDYFEIKITKITINKECGNGFEILEVKPEYKNKYDLLRLGTKINN